MLRNLDASQEIINNVKIHKIKIANPKIRTSIVSAEDWSTYVVSMRHTYWKSIVRRLFEFPER